MKFEIRSLSAYLEGRCTVVTLHHLPDCVGMYHFRVWSGPGIGSVRNNLFDTDGATNLLLFEITSRDRESLEFGEGPRSFLTGKNKHVRNDDYSIVDVWQ